jgi:hypothetical protein
MNFSALILQHQNEKGERAPFLWSGEKVEWRERKIRKILYCQVIFGGAIEGFQKRLGKKCNKKKVNPHLKRIKVILVVFFFSFFKENYEILIIENLLR